MSVGAIVFSTPYGGSGTGSGADWNNFWLSDPDFRHLVPFFLSIDGSNVVTGRGDTAAAKASEILRGRASGLDFFAYNVGTQVYEYFAAGIGYNGATDDLPAELEGWKSYVDHAMDGLTLHRASSVAHLVKYCVTLNGSTPVIPTPHISANNSTALNNLFSTHIEPWLTTIMNEANYMKVLTNRPLMFMVNPTAVAAEFTSSAACKAKIDAMRAAVQVGGAGNPYIVGLSSGGDMSAIKTTLGLDACGLYNRTNGSVGQTFAAFSAADVTQWATESSRYGVSRTVTCSGGFMRLPVCANDAVDRNSDPTLYQVENFCSNFPSAEAWNTPPTRLEFKNHLSAAKSQAATTTADIVLINAWYEIDSTIAFCPTYGNQGNYAQACAEVYLRQRDPPAALRARGLIPVSR